MVIGALEYLSKVGGETVDVTALEAASGVGQESTPAQIKAACAEVIASKKEILMAERYRMNGEPSAVSLFHDVYFFATNGIPDGMLTKMSYETALIGMLIRKTLRHGEAAL